VFFRKQLGLSMADRVPFRAARALFRAARTLSRVAMAHSRADRTHSRAAGALFRRAKDTFSRRRVLSSMDGTHFRPATGILNPGHSKHQQIFKPIRSLPQLPI
jgi:hypothetical protein